MDLFGPTRTLSLGDKLYWLIIIDVYSRYSCVLVLVHKSESYHVFEIFYKRV